MTPAQEQALSDEAMRLFGLDPETGEERPFGHLTDQELEDELAKTRAALDRLDAQELRDGCQLLELALGHDVCAKLAPVGDGPAVALHAEVDRLFAPRQGSSRGSGGAGSGVDR